jgi:hypothetical protein
MSELQKEVDELSGKWEEKINKIRALEAANQEMLDIESKVDEKRAKALRIAENLLTKSIAFMEKQQREAHYFEKLLPGQEAHTAQSTNDDSFGPLSIEMTEVQPSFVTENEDKIWDSRFNECTIMSKEIQQFLRKKTKNRMKKKISNEFI